jgi:hypothetical protein
MFPGQNNTGRALIIVAFLLNMVDAFSSNLQSLINSQNVRVSTHTMTVRKNISGSGGTYDVIDANTKQEKGISTIDGNKLNNEGFVFDRVAIGYGKGALAAGAGTQSYDSALPNELRNAFLVIKQSGRKIIHEPISNFTAQGTPQSPDEYFIDLVSLEYITDVDSFDIQIEYAPGVSLDAADAANNHYFEVRLQGAKTSARNA